MVSPTPWSKRPWWLVLAGLSFGLFAVVRAERLPIKIFTSADGLGSSASLSLVRDYRGFIWLGTRDGLVRFDGSRFITYRIGKPDDDPTVYSILPTRQGIYWINLNRGPDYRFIDRGDATLLEAMQQQDAKSDAQVPLKVEPITNLRFPSFEDSAGNLWSFEAKGLDLLREVDGKTVSQLIELQLPGNPDQRLTSAAFKPGSDGSFWIGTNWGLVRRLADGRFIQFLFDPQRTSNLIGKFVEDKENRVWIGSDDGILVLKVEPVSQLMGLGPFTERKVTISAGKIASDGQAELPTRTGEAFSFTFRDLLRRRAVSDGNTGMIKPKIQDLLCASNGTVWIADLNGLVSYDGKRFQHFTEAQGLASNIISQLVEDNDRNIWLGSYGGLMRLKPNGLTTFDLRDGLVDRRVHSIYETDSGELYVVTDNWNISGFREGVFKTARPQIPEDAFYLWHSNVALRD